jgi:hypothetical protein
MSKELIEQLAKLIYMQWIHSNGFVPWVDGGNSFKQDEARKIAKEFIEAYQASAPIEAQQSVKLDNNKIRACVLENLPHQATGHQIIDATIEVMRALIQDTQAKKGE